MVELWAANFFFSIIVYDGPTIEYKAIGGDFSIQFQSLKGGGKGGGISGLPNLRQQ